MFSFISKKKLLKEIDNLIEHVNYCIDKALETDEESACRNTLIDRLSSEKSGLYQVQYYLLHGRHYTVLKRRDKK